MKKIIYALFCLVFLSSPAPSQELVRIAAVVNDGVISMLDLLARIKLVAMSSGLSDTPEVREQLMMPVLQNLIEEQLKIQEAKQQGIVVSEEELANGVQMVEQQNGLVAGQINEWLFSLNIPYAFFERQIEAQILWGKYVATRLRPKVTVTEEDVAAEIEQLEANRGKPEYLISTIALYYGDAASTEELEATATRLVQQTRAGANFTAMASQFSQGKMGIAGSDIGWVREDQLQPEILAAVTKMRVGSVSDPVPTLEGLYIIYLREKREILSLDPTRVRLRLMQITLPIPGDSSEDVRKSQYSFVEEITRDLKGCDQMELLVGELNSPDSGDLGWVLLSDLPSEFREPVLNVEVGIMSNPVKSQFGVHVLMVCERQDLDQSSDHKETVRARLEAGKLEALGLRLLRDLRRNAFVDLRV